MMMSALKITAERIALSGVARCMTFSVPSDGYVVAKAAGMMAKYLATSLAMLNVVSAPRVISICLPVSTTSSSLVGFESRSIMLPASLAAWVPEFMATATSAWARAGASLVPSPVIATRRPSACVLRMSASLASGVASARKSSIPASAAMAAAVSGALARLAAVQVHAAHPRLGRERHEGGAQLLDVALADRVLLLGQHHDAAPLRRLVGQRGELGGVGEVTVAHARRGNELGGLAIAERDGAGLVEQQHVDVTGRLHRPARHGDDVLLDHAVHAGDADGGEQRADRGRDEAHQQGDEHGHRHRRPLPGRL